jgi:hypothetical protein
MNERRAQVRSVLGALGLLLGISVYRQLSLRLWPGDLVRPYAVYAVYLFLLAFWMASLRSRITQKNMRFFLLLDAAVMLLWLSIRFVQDAFLLNKIYPLRFLGYFINVPAVFVPLLGFYASFGLGRGDDYRFAGKWRLLLLPALALTAMALTNESHHFLCRVVPTEPQPNLYFHPYIGTYLIILWALFFIAARTIVIYRRNRPPQNASALQKLAPYAEVCLLLIFSTPYVLSSFWVHWELIEFSAGVFFIEAASWELFIAIGLIPVNTQYKTVFDLSTAAMQIVTEDGRPVVRSAGAPELNARTWTNCAAARPFSFPAAASCRCIGFAAAV